MKSTWRSGSRERLLAIERAGIVFNARPPMSPSWDFRDVLELLESHGWVLKRIDPPYRVFMKADQLPILIPVHEKKVSGIYVEKIRAILGLSGEE